MTLTPGAPIVRQSVRSRGALLVTAMTALGLWGATPAGAVVEREAGFSGTGAPVGFAQDDFGTLAVASSVAAVPNDGGVVAAGYGQNAQGKYIAVGRYTTGGQREPLFGTPRAFHPTDVSGRPNAVGNDVVVDPDGYVTVVGTIGDGTSERLVILRITRTGQLDPTFGDPNAFGTGRKGYHVEPGTIRSTGRTILRRSDGYVVGGAVTCTIAGDPGHTCALVQRYDAQGVRQSSRSLDAGLDAEGGIYALAGSTSSNIVAAGQADSETGRRTVGATYVFDPAGTYISGTFRSTADPDGDVSFRAVTTDLEPRPAGDNARGFIVAGTAVGRLIRRQFTAAGAPASALPGGGELRLGVPATADGLAISQQPGGRTILGGLTVGKPLLARTNRDGAGLDPGFFSTLAGGGAAGTIIETSFDRYSEWRALSEPVLDGNGGLSVYAAGTRTFAPIGAAFLLARYAVALPPQAYLTFPAAKPGNVFSFDDAPSVDYIGRPSPSGDRIVRTEVLWDGQPKFAANQASTGTLALPAASGTHTVKIVTTDADGLRTEREVSYRKDEVDAAADDDGDGLPNGWELTGDIDGDGKQDLDLPAMGANYKHKDLFVRLDWMKDHQIDRTALAKVTAAFAAAPIANPDGTTGISLHLDHGSDAVMIGSSSKKWGALSRAKELTHVDSLGKYVETTNAAGEKESTYDWGDFDKLDQANTTALERKVFRYGISIHKYAGKASSGLARTGGDTFMVSMGDAAKNCDPGKTECSWGTTDAQARTVMHEFGHTLGLRHGGTDAVNFKPQYPSLMNYLWQLEGPPTATADSGAFTFSNFTTAQIGSLDEAKLSESSGVTATGAAAGARSGFVCLGKKQADIGVEMISFGQAVDWNCDGKTEKAGSTVSGDLTDDALEKVVAAPATGDWAGVKFKGGAIGSPGASANPPRPKRTVIDEANTSLLKRLSQLVRKDFTKPKITLSAAPGKRRAGQPVTLRISASDQRGIDRLQITVDGRPVQPPALPGTRSLKVQPRPIVTLAKGKRRIVVIAIDTAGNMASRSIELRVR